MNRFDYFDMKKDFAVRIHLVFHTCSLSQKEKLSSDSPAFVFAGLTVTQGNHPPPASSSAQVGFRNCAKNLGRLLIKVYQNQVVSDQIVYLPFSL